MNRILLVAAACAAFVVSGCGGATVDSGGVALLRVIHASADTDAIDVELQDVPIVSELGYQGSFPSSGSAPKQITSGLDTLAVLESGTSNVLLDDSPAFDSGHLYTLLVTGLSHGGSSDPLQGFYLDDAVSGLSSSVANIRFVNVTTLSGNVDIYVTGPDDTIDTSSPTVSNLGKYGASDLVKVAAGAYRVRICPKGSKTATVDQTLTATAGTYVVDVFENNSEGSSSVLQTYTGTF